MIVDKINSYLSSNQLTVDDRLQYTIERLAGGAFKRQFMEDHERSASGKCVRQTGALYFSASGKCVRQLAYKHHNFEPNGKEVDSRSRIVFWMGDLVEITVVGLAKLAGCQVVGTGFDQITVRATIEGHDITGHPDGIFLNGSKNYLLEVKSFSGYAFTRFEKGDIDGSYVAQVNSYMHKLNLNQCIFVGINKESGVLAEQVVSLDQTVVDKTRARFTAVINSTPDTLPEGEYAVNEKGFYPWQCLYCAYWGLCHPTAEKVLVGKSYKLKEKGKKNGNS